MKIKNLLKYTEKPEIYTKGTATIWTDPHISKQLLAIHLHKEIDLASRRQTTIDQTVSWIINKTSGKKLNILDLGCGPGLYAEQLAARGHQVTGMDFSKSIAIRSPCRLSLYRRRIDVSEVSC